MLGLLGILLSLGLLMYLAYRGYSVIALAPVSAMLAVVISGEVNTMLGIYTQIFMQSLGGYIIKYFPLFLLDLSPGNPLISMAIVVNVLAGITGSASGGLSIALQAMGETYSTLAHQFNISPELMHRVASLASGGLDSLPHNGAVISILAICSLTHKESYFDMFVVGVLIPLIALVVVISLGTAVGSF